MKKLVKIVLSIIIGHILLAYLKLDFSFTAWTEADRFMGLLFSVCARTVIWACDEMIAMDKKDKKYE